MTLSEIDIKSEGQRGFGVDVPGDPNPGTARRSSRFILASRVSSSRSWPTGT